ncbi:DivIVA domain-containing protein [uncultured Corynebacterium sp.]|uniref:DivIVA domain-containing protein n=1 Tax=uncultured Corynebacterium sp. TaxID=159447 RepID=UPI00259A40CF|nr:DivIVA domain-containing protein [uncultured Corynebacterium sp.]
MYWLFSFGGAVLVGALLTYLLSTSFGRGEELPPATRGPLEPEHRAQLEQAPVSADSVDNVRFATAVRGYNQQEVDAYLRRISARLAEYEARDTAIEIRGEAQ